MNRIVNFLQHYLVIIAVLIGISILLSVTFSSYIVTSNNHKAAEMYIGELKYSIEIDGSSTNTLTVPTGETIVDVKVNNLNPVDTYYKLLYLKNANITVKYYESTKDTDDVVTTYNKPSDSITSSNSNIVKLLITNNSASSQNIALTMKGGYITNTIQDIIAPSTYSEITLVETPSTNTYFCKTNDTLTWGLKYINGQYSYGYRSEGCYTSSGLSWDTLTNDGWGVQLTDKTNTDAVTSKLCTYINNKPVVSMSYMFLDSQATSIDLSSFDTSNVVNMRNMFSSSQATTLDLSNFDTRNVENMYGMFSSNQATTLDLSNFDTRNVENMYGMFWNSKANNLDLSSFDTSNVVNMSGMFNDSKAISIIGLDKFNTAKVTNMSWMFSGSEATTLDLSSFDTSNVTNMISMFEESKATTIDVSNFDTRNVTNMNDMFYYSKATTIKGLENFDTSKVTNMYRMFCNSKATILDVSNFDTSNVVNMSYMFSWSQATTLDVSNFNTSKVTAMRYMFERSKATTLDLSNFDTSNVTDMGSMFISSQVTVLDVSNFDTSNVTDMSGMFYDSKVTTLDVSNFNTSKVTNMSGIFYGSKATTLDLSSFDTSNVTNMYQMFYNSKNLKTIYVSDKFNIDAVTKSNNMFYNCSSLVGGAGTAYDSTKIDKTYAHIDGGTSNPGYFTSIPEPNSFSTDSWMTIAKAVKSGNISKYNVGDTRTINMGTYGTHTLRIANTSTWSKCSTSSFSQSACGFVLEFTDIITTHNINPSGVYNGTQYDYGWNKDGWPASSMYAFVNNDIYNALPSDLRNVIINTRVISGHGSEDTENFTSIDKLYLLSFKEIYSDYPGTYSVYDTATNQTKILDYYKKQGVTITNNSGAIKKNGTNVYSWWLRANGTNSNSSFGIVYSDGRLMDGATSSTYGVSPAFRIG